MVHNFTGFVEPILQFPGHSVLLDRFSTLILLVKAFMGGVIFPIVVPEGAMCHMIPTIGLFYWYCTGLFSQFGVHVLGGGRHGVRIFESNC
ncbi:hypothetical protein CDAR_506471 [Caerostris darwini]|nr:hypothetical protein CDAR_506471 [Caerostris darwini]